MNAPAVSPALDNELADFVSQFYADPLGFVRACYPWGEPGPLQDYDGPDEWQTQVLTSIGEQIRLRRFDGVHPVEPIRVVISSGHGIGKSTLQAWLVDWIMSTRPNCRGTVTANTNTQLDTKTWAAIVRWTKLCLTSHWFEINSARFYRINERSAWFCAPQSSKEENSEAFAGQHAADSTSFYVIDEGSAVPDVIYDVAEGGLTDGEPMIFVFGNPTRSTGRFYQICFGQFRERWSPLVIDSRTATFTNKTQIAEWIQDYGEDSDFVRVRVRGLPPAASDLQFISNALVFGAQNREPAVLPADVLVAGLDVARGGDDSCVIRFRRGADAKSIPAIRIPGEQARDSMRLVTVAADVLARTYAGNLKVHTLFVDGTGIGGPIVDRMRQMGHTNVVEVQFGSESPDAKYANMRAFMWAKMRDWLPRGAIDKDPKLEMDLVGPGYAHDKRDRVVLESKEKMKARGLSSPDDGDALGLTFAMPVAVTAGQMVQPYRPRGTWT